MSLKKSNGSSESIEQLHVPAQIIDRIQKVLPAGSQVVAFVVLDINEARQFDDILLALAGGILIEQCGRNPARTWKLTESTALRSTVFSGLGSLVLIDSGTAIKTWSFTAAKAADVSRLMVLTNEAAIEKHEVDAVALSEPIKSVPIPAPAAATSAVDSLHQESNGTCRARPNPDSAGHGCWFSLALSDHASHR
jgi:hypothetical protein